MPKSDYDVLSDNRTVRSYRSVAAELKISPARVQQIEQRALAKLRRAFAKRGIFGLEENLQKPC
jgi:DNA-directed RNA polymerase sigma subunit (sigma70/sigma32)